MDSHATLVHAMHQLPDESPHVTGVRVIALLAALRAALSPDPATSARMRARLMATIGKISSNDTVDPGTQQVEAMAEAMAEAMGCRRESSGAAVLSVALPAHAAAGPVVREQVRAWLDELHWPPEDREDVVAAVTEAIENVVDHAYHASAPDTVEVHGDIQSAAHWMRRAVLSIIDHGQWRAPGHTADRGRGFTIMGGTMASVRAVLTDQGTRIEMRSRPVPRPGLT